MKDNNAIVLLSGGINSALCADIAQRCSHHEKVTALHLSFGQLASAQEFIASQKIARHYGIDFASVHMDCMYEVRYNKDGHTIIPFRNGVFLSFAAAYAKKHNAENIYIGITKDDRDLPDCTVRFVDAMQETIDAGIDYINICTPLIEMTKDEIIEMCMQNYIPIDDTWSCYNDAIVPCKSCSACRRRITAIENYKRSQTKFEIDES